MSRPTKKQIQKELTDSEMHLEMCNLVFFQLSSCTKQLHHPNFNLGKPGNTKTDDILEKLQIAFDPPSPPPPPYFWKIHYRFLAKCLRLRSLILKVNLLHK